MTTRELTDGERLRLICDTLEACGEEVTPAAVARQFHRETGRDLEGKVFRFGGGLLAFTERECWRLERPGEKETPP